MTSGADRIEALVKQRIERGNLERQRMAGGGSVYFKPLQLPGTSDSPVRDYQRQRWSLAELLAYYDRQFVQNAYLVLLKRDADVEGLTQRLHKLHTGELSRLEVLFRLRYGPEGKEHKTVVRGLMRAFLLERACRIPVLGLIPRYILAVLRLPRMQRDIEEIRALMAMQHNDSEDKHRAIVDFQNRELGRVISRLRH